MAQRVGDALEVPGRRRMDVAVETVLEEVDALMQQDIALVIAERSARVLISAIEALVGRATAGATPAKAVGEQGLFELRLAGSVDDRHAFVLDTGRLLAEHLDIVRVGQF